MTLSTSAFEYTNRGFRKNLVLIPGWAADCRIFGTLDLAYNYIFPGLTPPDRFVCNLSDFLKRIGADSVTLLGLSMGGFLSADFA